MNAITERVALEVAYHEAIVRQTYKDSVGVLTWSVGMTNATGHTVERYIDKPAELQHCINVYIWALDRYAEQVRQVFYGHTLTEAQFAAALSFHWNTGAIKRANWVKSFKAGQINKAKEEFMNWVTPSEITKRRKAERDLFFDGKWSNNGTILEITRLTASMQPVWSSGRHVDISAEVRNALRNGKPVTIVPDTKPEPNRVPAAPTATNGHSIWTVIISFINNMFGK